MCPFCGSEYGMPYKDSYLTGMLCLQSECGRFYSFSGKESEEINSFRFESDL